MSITPVQIFWLGLTSLIVLTILHLRQQKILKTLSVNLVTIQIKHEDSTNKLVDLCDRATGLQESILDILKKHNSTLHADQTRNFMTQLRDIEDRFQQNKIILEDHVETCVLKGINELRSQLESRIQETPAPSGSILDQIQKLNVDQLYDLAKKSSPLLDVLGKLRNGTSPKS